MIINAFYTKALLTVVGSGSVFIRVFDKDSGIKFLNFSIFDGTLKLTHRSDTAKVHMRDPPTTNQNRHTKKRQVVDFVFHLVADVIVQFILKNNDDKIVSVKRAVR